MREWNADAYHHVSTPQFDWGMRVLDRLPLEGDELVLDVGCGTGRLTEKLSSACPVDTLIALDLSSNMLHVRARLSAATIRRPGAACSWPMRRICRPWTRPTPSSARRRFTGCAIIRGSSGVSSLR